MFLFCSKTLQKSRHVAMGRKKFNMDPKKVPLFFVVLRLTFTFIFPFPLYTEYLPLAGHPVLGGERAGQTHGRGHRSVPVQGRRPQQDCHRRLPGGEVPHADNFIRLSLLTHQSHIFFFSSCPIEMISISKFFKLLLTSMSLLTSTWCKPSGKFCTL